MSRLIERMKRCLRREVILYYDGEYWWAHDPDEPKTKGGDSIIFKHSVLDVVLEGIEAYFHEKEMRNEKV